MTNQNGWPDPDRPGVPLNPAESGWYYLHGCPRFWSSIEQFWYFMDCRLGPTAVKDCAYQGPCLPPAEVNALIEQARQDGAQAMKKMAVVAVRLSRFECEFNSIGRSRGVPMLSPNDFKDQVTQIIGNLQLPPAEGAG